jgi:thiol-disulfide isomerase/thioredoxin
MVDGMAERIDEKRRRFLTRAAMAFAGAHLGIFEADAIGASRELAAFGRAVNWLNSPRLTAEDLAGKVVLVDFWTYTCINWLRTLPYIRAWAQKYRQGLVVIGVHTPEFTFEQDLDNVRRAVQQMKLEYPIVIDNDNAIWRAFDNHYWPALYLVDGRGRVRHHQFGEGEYQASERAIQRTLKEAGVSGVGDGVVSANGSGVEAAADWTNLRSPETYVGSARMENFASLDAARVGQARTYRPPSRLALNQWSLAGDWTIGKQATALNSVPGRIIHRFHARDAHLVMGPARPGTSVRFRVSLDGQPPGASRGIDIDQEGNGRVSEQRLHQLIRQPAPIVERQLAIEFLDPGVEAFSFTFG